MNVINQTDTVGFIPARKSALFTSSFRLYAKWLFKRRFKAIWIHQDYKPDRDSRTVYFLNHTSWWDGLIPLLLNEYRFYQQARAMMELKQMKKYPFFKWLGAFSVNPDDLPHTLRSLRYARKSMKQPHSSLYIYPEGEIKPVGSTPHFKAGLGWLCNHLSEIDVVPIGIHIQTVRHYKSELHIWAGEPLRSHQQPLNRNQITEICERMMNEILERLFETAGFDDTMYEPFFR